MADASAARHCTVRVGTDVAVLMHLHPDGLQRHADAPTAWQSVPFAYQVESVTGRSAAVGTVVDGGSDIRLTTGGLTGPETAHDAALSETFPVGVMPACQSRLAKPG